MPFVVVEEAESGKGIPQEVKPNLEKFVDVLLEEIPHGLVFPHKLAFILNTKEHEELITQVDGLLEKWLVQEGESSYVVPTMLVHENDGS